MGPLFRKPIDLANILQKHYISKVQKLMDGLKRGGQDPLKYLDRAMNRWEGKDGLKTFTLREISKMETLKFVKKLGNTTAHGLDGLDSLSVKSAADELTGPLTHIINVSIRTRTFANKWKLSRIIPLLKSNEVSRLDPASYRPVSLLPTISKLVERAVQSQLQQHLETQGLLNHNGHAYRADHSTATAILQITDRLYTATDRNLISQLLAIDQSSAFDCVNHRILLLKLQKYGCSQETIQWMTSYLESRSQLTNIGRHNSSMAATLRGVPQGSILGPLLYLVYTNKITEVIRDENCTNQSHNNNRRLFGENCETCGQIVLYADDATYQVTAKTRVQNQLRINLNLARLENYLSDNELAVNSGKTSILELMIKQKKGRTGGEPPHLIVKTQTGEMKTIKDNKNFRVLGTHLQQNMSWQNQLEAGPKAVTTQN